MTLTQEPSRRVLVISLLVAIALQTVPLPNVLATLRPPIVLLVVLFWSVVAPRLGGIAIAFVAGIAMDVFHGVVLGQHALAACIVAYIAIRMHLLLRNQTLLQQCLFVFAAVFLYEAIVWAIDGWTGHAIANPWRWLSPVLGAICWPLVAAIVGRYSR
ncbi:MAG: rod shape-determining protein MreD [Steroidobacteraceae bacterium]